LFQIIVYQDNEAQTNASLVKGGGFCIAKDGGIIIKYNHNKSLISVEYIDLCVKQSLSQN